MWKEINPLKERNGDTQVGKKNELYIDIDRSVKINDLKHFFIQSSGKVILIMHSRFSNWDGCVKKRYIRIEILSSLIPISWTLKFFFQSIYHIAESKSTDRIIEIESQSCRPTHKKIKDKQ